MEVLLFGGTVEGRELAEWLDARGCQVLVCVASDYGASLLPSGGRVSCLRGPLSAEEKRALVASHNFCCIVDATHPYACHISQSVAQLSRDTGLDLLRIVRSEPVGEGPWEQVASAEEAAQLLAQSEGRVLLTTGSKELGSFVRALPDAAERLYVRILPTVEALEQARQLGIPASHIVAMQGPFSRELNEALLRQLDIRCLVSKQSGSAGGFEEKVQAAQACGVRLIVIERPHEKGGVSLAEAQAILEERYGL